MGAECAVAFQLLILWAFCVTEHSPQGPLLGTGVFISWVGWESRCAHHQTELPGMVSLGPVQKTFFTGSPLMVNSSLHVPSACVGFTYTKGSWWIVTICEEKHKHPLVSIPLQSYVPLGKELGCPLHTSMVNMPWCSPQLPSQHMRPLSPAAGPGFGTGNICFPCTQDEEQPYQQPPSCDTFPWPQSLPHPSP